MAAEQPVMIDEKRLLSGQQSCTFHATSVACPPAIELHTKYVLDTQLLRPSEFEI